MRDAAGHGAYRFHFLRLTQLPLEPFFLGLCLPLRGHVRGGAGEADRLALRVAQTMAAGAQPVPIAIRLTDPILAFVTSCSSREVISDGRVEICRIVRVHCNLPEPRRSAVDYAIRVQAEQRFHFHREKYS